MLTDDGLKDHVCPGRRAGIDSPVFDVIETGVALPAMMLKVMDKYKNDLPAIVKQLKSCEYISVGGRLENNMAFMELEKMAEKQEKII